jgi:hypothetical protein
MMIPLAKKVKLPVRFIAQINGALNWVPNKAILVFTGETLIVSRFLPIDNCHHEK